MDGRLWIARDGVNKSCFMHLCRAPTLGPLSPESPARARACPAPALLPGFGCRRRAAVTTARGGCRFRALPFRKTVNRRCRLRLRYMRQGGT
jgi:hypothetical protein